MGQRRSQDFRDLLGALQRFRIPSETGRIEPHCLPGEVEKQRLTDFTASFLFRGASKCSMVGRRNILSIGRATTRSISRTLTESSWNLSIGPDVGSRRDVGMNSTFRRFKI